MNACKELKCVRVNFVHHKAILTKYHNFHSNCCSPCTTPLRVARASRTRRRALRDTIQAAPLGEYVDCGTTENEKLDGRKLDCAKQEVWYSLITSCSLRNNLQHNTKYVDR